MPSICRRPLRIFCVSFEAMLSKARESNASIASDCRPCSDVRSSMSYLHPMTTNCRRVESRKKCMQTGE